MELFEDDNDLDVVEFIINGIPRRIYTRSDYFNTLDPSTYFLRFRMSKTTTLMFLEEIEQHLEYPYNSNNCVAPINQFLIFLRFCATSNHLSAIADFGGVHLATAGRIIERVARTVASRYPHHVKFPSTQQEILMAKTGFYEMARFPQVLGVIDCTHIRIESPGGSDAEVFRNRKGFFSINVQAICNADLEAINIVARWPGSCHDSTIFQNSRIRAEFENNKYPDSLLLGDSGYPVKNYLLTPLDEPSSQSEHLYNESHIRTRNAIERFFGIWKRRFPVLAYGLRLKLETTMNIIVATAVLNNVCRKLKEKPPSPDNISEFIRISEENKVPNIQNFNNQDSLGSGFRLRSHFVSQYFQNLQN